LDVSASHTLTRITRLALLQALSFTPVFARYGLTWGEHLVLAVVVSPDGQSFASGGADNTARLWDAQSGKELRTFTGHSYEVCSVAFSPNGRDFVTAGRASPIWLWHVSPAKRPVFDRYAQVLSGHSEGTRSVAFSPDGEHLLSGGDDGVVRLWPAFRHSEVSCFKLPEGRDAFERQWESFAVAFSPDGRLAFSSSDQDRSVRTWDTATGFQLQREKVNNSSDSNRWLVLRDRENRLSVWDARLQVGLGFLDGATGSQVTGLTVSPDGTLVAAQFRNSEDLLILDPRTGKQIWSFKYGSFAHQADCLAFSPDSSLVLACSEFGSVKVWGVATGQQRFSCNPSVTHLAISPDGKLLACPEGLLVRLFDLQTGAALRPLTGAARPLICAAFTPDGRFAIVVAEQLRRLENGLGCPSDIA